MWAMGGYRVKYETPQIKDFGSIAEHTFMPTKCGESAVFSFSRTTDCQSS